MKKLLSLGSIFAIVVLYLCLAVTPAFADPGDEHQNNNEGSKGQGATELHQNRHNQ